MRKPRIAVIGSNNVDLVTYVERVPGPGETIEAPRFEMGPGGKGANQAVAAAKLGAEVVFLTCVGGDLFADNTLSNLAALGIDVSYARRVPDKASGVATILVEPNGENRILIVKGANADLSPADIERAGEALKTCDLILLQLEVALETVYAALDFGRRHGVRTVLNPAPANPALDLALARRATFLMPNETELGLLTGLPTRSDSEVETAASGLLGEGMQAVVVTLGSRGALVVTAQGATRIRPIVVSPVDTTGAGDAFVGAFARFHAAGAGIEAALERAARYAADSVRRNGAQNSYAKLNEFEAFERSL